MTNLTIEFSSIIYYYETTMMTAEHKAYLDRLRDSGMTNMYFATDHLINKFRITYEEAKAILIEWMELYK